MFHLRVHRAFAALATLGLSLPLAAGPVPVVDGAAPLEPDRFAALATGDRIIVEGLRLAAADRVDLHLERFEVLAPGARVVVASADGERELDTSRVTLLRGRVAGDIESFVFLGVAPSGVQGFIERNGALHFLSTGAYTRDAGVRRLVAADAAALPAPNDAWCQVDLDDDTLFPLGRPALATNDGARSAAGAAPCRAARVAIDSDWEFTSNLFQGDTDAAADYALFLAAAISEIYRRDVNTRLLVSYLRVWADNSDPYDADTTGEALNQLRDHWRANHGDVEREVTHLFSGDGLGGGVAYLSVVCSTQWGYGVSANLGGSFPYPLQDNDHGNWDPYVVAHELGHNFGTLHTHDGYDPPIDECGLGNCDGANQGTIMSYCHGCPGGMSNIQLHFHPRVIEQVVGYLDGVPCDVSQSGVVAADDRADTWEDAAVVVDILANDVHASCDGEDVALDTFDASSTEGGTVTLVPAGGEELDRLEYTPAAGYTGGDSFTYRLLGGAEAIVEVDIGSLRDPDVTGVTEPGAAVGYYELDGPVELPEFDMLVPYAEDVVPVVNFPLTGGNFATSRRRTDVGAVFTGFIRVPDDGPYTLYTESDAGSALYLGGELVVDNDGVHAMREEAGDVLLHAGPHAVRVEFFNNTGGSGLIVSIEGLTLEKQPVDADAWSHPTCAEDLDASGEVDFGDVLAVLAAWGNAGGPEDLDGSGTVDFGDILAVLAVWGPCS